MPEKIYIGHLKRDWDVTQQAMPTLFFEQY